MIYHCGWNGMGMHQRWYRICLCVGGAHSTCDKGVFVCLILRQIASWRKWSNNHICFILIIPPIIPLSLSIELEDYPYYMCFAYKLPRDYPFALMFRLRNVDYWLSAYFNRDVEFSNDYEMGQITNLDVNAHIQDDDQYGIYINTCPYPYIKTMGQKVPSIVRCCDFKYHTLCLFILIKEVPFSFYDCIRVSRLSM